MLGLRFCARAFSSCSKRGPLFIAVRGPLTIVASLVAEHRLQMRRLSSCGSRAQLLRGMWDLPRPGLEPASPALAGRFSTTAPPGKPPYVSFYANFGRWPKHVVGVQMVINLTETLVKRMSVQNRWLRGLSGSDTFSAEYTEGLRVSSKSNHTPLNFYFITYINSRLFWCKKNYIMVFVF